MSVPPEGSSRPKWPAPFFYTGEGKDRDLLRIIHGSTQSADISLVPEFKTQTKKSNSTMEPMVETRPSRNLPSMTTVKENRLLKDSRANLKDISFLLHTVIASMNNGFQ